MPIPKNIRTGGKIRNSIRNHFHKPDFKPEDMRPLKEWIDKHPKCNIAENKFPPREDTPEYGEWLMYHHRLNWRLNQIFTEATMRHMQPVFKNRSRMKMKLYKVKRLPAMIVPQKTPLLKLR